MSKGGENERNIAKFLTKWLTGKEKPYMFWRQDASGGLATVHAENTHMTGDIVSIHPDSKFFCDKFTVECKTGYPTTSFWQHLTSSKFNLEDFWKQTLTDAKKSDKYPMLIYRKLNKSWIIGIDSTINNAFWKQLFELNSIVVRFGGRKYDRKDMNIVYMVDCILYNMKDFFERIKPENIKELGEKIKNGKFEPNNKRV